MKKRLFLFLALLLFLAIPLPMLSYYGPKSDNMADLLESNPWFSLGLAALSLLFWLIIVVRCYRRWVLGISSTKRHIKHLKATGIPREAKILQATKLSEPNSTPDIYELKLGFKNLAGSEIVQTTLVNDIKPYERHFDIGKRIDLLIDKDVKHMPYFVVANTETGAKKNPVVLLTLCWLVLLCLIAAYYVYSYQQESEGMGWRFISSGHPLIVCPAILLFYDLIWFLFNNHAGKHNNIFLIKFKGTETNAKLIRASHAGSYSNEHPMINFELEFLDNHNKKHRVNIQRIVNLLDLDLTKQENIPIFYLREDPQQIAFAQDLDKIFGKF